MDTTRDRALRKLVLVTDGAIVAVSAVLAFFVHAGLRALVPVLKSPPAFEEYFLVVVIALPVWLALIARFDLHRVFERVWTRGELVAGLARLHLVGAVALAALLFLSQAVLNRSLVAVFLASSFTLLYAERAALGSWVRFQHERGHARERLLLVGGASEELARFVRHAQASALPPTIVGIVGEDAASNESAAPEGVRPIGAIADLPAILHREPVDRVLFFPPHDDPHRELAAIEHCETVGVPAAFALDLTPAGKSAPTVRRLSGATFLEYELATKPATSLAIKHASDVAASAIGLVLLAPLFVITALAILVTMGRPVFYRQDRAGLRGRPFRMLKFRTMVVDAEQRQAELQAKNEMSGPVFKVTGDPRVTRLGAFLRRTSIDELPQLVNVIGGTMSLVGPRPLPVKEQQAIRGWHRRRLSMKPGITCLWQIGGRNDVDFEEWMGMDLDYVDRWSIPLDLRILLATIPVVLSRRGAR